MSKLIAVGAVLLIATGVRAQERRMLHNGWRLQSSAKVGVDGEKISSAAYDASGWYTATAPSTVAGALVENGTFKDPFFGMNLRELPGMSFKIGQNFVHLPMDSTSPYAVPWWYRTKFTASRVRGRHVLLQFDGINYRANVWINGHRIADSSHVVGTYRRYEFDVTEQLAANGTNVLAVEIFAPTPPDLQTTWVDWNPSPPDKDMGLSQPVWLATTGDVVVRYPHVVSHVDATAGSADLTIGADIRNLSAETVSGVVQATAAGP